MPDSVRVWYVDKPFITHALYCTVLMQWKIINKVFQVLMYSTVCSIRVFEFY